jgi:hypothetical protein
MKKISALLLFSFLLSASLFSQAIRYEVKIKYTHAANQTAANITVTVREGEPGFTYFLMTNDPRNGKVLMQSESSAGKSYTFRDVKPGKYFIKITDKMGLPAGKTVEVKENENGKN